MPGCLGLHVLGLLAVGVILFKAGTTAPAVVCIVLVFLMTIFTVLYCPVCTVFALQSERTRSVLRTNSKQRMKHPHKLHIATLSFLL